MRRVLLVAAVVLFGWGGLVLLTGGIDTRVLGVAIRSREPFRSLVGSLACALTLALFFRSEFSGQLDRAVALVRGSATAIAVALALALAAHALVFGSFAVGGADEYGYVNQAYDWASGVLPRAIALPPALPFPTSDQMLMPLGYRLGPAPHTMVPTYPVGLPLMMAAMLAFGPCGPFLVVPIFAALFVWFTFLLGRRAAGPVAGAVAAAVLAASPAVLFQAVWPMSDVPSGALWTGAAACSLGGRRGSAVLAGICMALGLLMRPNLVLLPIAPLAAIAAGVRGRERWIRVGLFVLPLVPVTLLVGMLNATWYGAPWLSGYGATGEIYSAANLWPNLKRYSSWLWQSESPWMLIALVPLLPVFAMHVERRARRLVVLLIFTTLCCYLPYAQFDAWWYLRFLLPAFGALAVLIAAGLIAIARTAMQPFGRIASAAVLWLLLVSMLSFANGKGVFGLLRAGERRYIDVSQFVARALPDNAALFSMQYSGPLRFYSGRLTLRYDRVKKEWAKDVPALVERAGYHPYMVIDEWETPYVRPQFGLPDDSVLPWPVIARMREFGGVTVFDMATHPNVASPVALVPGGTRLCEARHRLYTK